MNTSQAFFSQIRSHIKIGSNPYLWFAFAIIVTAGIYSMGLHGPMLFDDFINLSSLMQSSDAGMPLVDLLKSFGFNQNGPLGRPVSMLSFAVNAKLFGSDLFYWKLVNLIIHCLNGSLLFLLLKTLFVRVAQLTNNANVFAFFVSAIWLLNPAQLSSVLYLVQRMNLLAAFFTLLCLLFYVSGKNHILFSGKLLRYLAAAGSFLLAVFSKENAILCLGFIAIIELYFFDGMARVREKLTPKQMKTGRYVLAIIGLSFLILLYFSYADKYGARTFTIGERLLTEPRVIFFYIYQWLVPIPRNLPFFYDDFAASKSLFSPLTTILSIIAIVGAVWLAYRLRNSKVLISASITWFLVGHSLEGSFVPLHLVFEHRNYLPSIGISIILVYLFTALDIKAFIRNVSIFAYFLFVIFLLAIRANTWNDEKLLYTSLLAYRPHSEDLISANANILISEKKYKEAKQLLSSKVTPATLLHTAYVQCVSTGKVSGKDLDAITHMTQDPVSSYWTSAATNLVNYALSDGCRVPETALDNVLEKGAAYYGTPSQHFMIVLYRAHWAQKHQHMEKAFALLDELIKTHHNPIPLFLRAEWLLDENRAKEAIESLAEGKKRAAGDIQRYREIIEGLEKRLSSR